MTEEPNDTDVISRLKNVFCTESDGHGKKGKLNIVIVFL